MKFLAGTSVDAGGVTVRFVRGVKAPDDLRMEIQAVRWTPVSMKLGYVMADFYAQNERVLYPFRGDAAGERYIVACRGAQFLGWEDAAAKLDQERADARARRDAA